MPCLVCYIERKVISLWLTNLKANHLEFSMSKTSKLITLFLEVGILSVALVVSVQSVKPFSWPFSWDALRDIAIAQTIYDGQFPQDPILKDEINWYNPLIGIIIAIVGKATNLSLPEAYVRISPYLTLLLPISFALFAYKINGATASLATLCYCIFARHPLLIEWIYGCYLPWLYATHFAKAFFFLYLTALLAYKKNAKPISLILSGLFLGLAFLSHTSAFLEGLIIAIIITLWENRATIKSLKIANLIRSTTYVFILIAITLFVSSIYWIPILLKYQFIIKNPYPALYLTPALEPSKILDTLTRSANSFTVLGSICFLVFLFPKTSTYTNLYILRVWTLTTSLVALYQILCIFLNKHGYIIPPPYPFHHTFISLHLLIGCFFGYGVSSFAAQIANKLSPQSAKKDKYEFFNLFTTISICLVCVLINAYLYSFTLLPPFSELYRGRPENGFVQESEKYNGTYRWLIQNTLPQDKILCDEILAVRVVMPAGRKVVYPFMFYLNPYVNLVDHLEKYSKIWKALKDKRYPDFIAYLRKENIKYVIVHNSDSEFTLLSQISKLKIVYSDELVSVFQTVNLSVK